VRPTTEIERLIEARERACRRLDDVLAALDAGILVVGTEGRIEQANPAASALTGLERAQLVGRVATPWLGPVERGEEGEVVHAGANAPQVLHVARRALPSEPAAEVVLLREGTGQPDAECIARVSAALVALADLTHKINNPLTSLLGRAQILKLKLDTDPSLRKAADVVEESARRIADHVRELAGVVRDTRRDLARSLGQND
jgi:PAS domain-containing protein